MALLERVSTLLRANVNDMIDKAENPEKTLRQLLLDMENQLLQVKTQVAIAIADQHLLEKKKKEHEEAAEVWHRKAELAVAKGQDDLARAALDRSLSHQQLAEGFSQQIEDQRSEAEIMRTNYGKLQQKLKETEARCEILIAQNRRARAVGKANAVHAASTGSNTQPLHAKDADEGAWRRGRQLRISAACSRMAIPTASSDSLDDRFRKLERDDRIESLLNEIKGRPTQAG